MIFEFVIKLTILNCDNYHSPMIYKFAKCLMAQALNHGWKKALLSRFAVVVGVRFYGSSSSTASKAVVKRSLARVLIAEYKQLLT